MQQLPAASWPGATRWSSEWVAVLSALLISWWTWSLGTKGGDKETVSPLESIFSVCVCRKVLKQIEVGDLLPDETVGAVKEAQLLAKVRHFSMQQVL